MVEKFDLCPQNLNGYSSQRNKLPILVKLTEFGLYLLFSNWYDSKRNSARFKINRKMANTIWFWVNFTWMRSGFVCVCPTQTEKNQTEIRLYLPYLGTANGMCPLAVPNLSGCIKYNLISVWFSKISERFLWVQMATHSIAFLRWESICLPGWEKISKLE